MFPRSTFQIAAICLTLFSSSVWFFGSRGGSGTNSYSHYGRATATGPVFGETNVFTDEPKSDPIWDIQNSTLGFQKIYAISMPHRTDKRDTLVLMALVTGLEIEFIDGVNGSNVHSAAYPSFWAGDDTPGTLGCWRAHMDLYQKMVQERIQSALVLEDDADWDVLIKAQMTEFARGTRYLQNATLPLHSPYGDNWDLLAVGHTGVNNKPYIDQHYWISQNDPTVIHPSRRDWFRLPDLTAPGLEGDYTRIVHEVQRLTGTAAYAVSLRGAARLLWDQTMGPKQMSIDTAQANLCRHDPWGNPFCLGAYPMLFGRYRAAGSANKDSDRRLVSNEKEVTVGQAHGVRLEPNSMYTVFPASLNAMRLLGGATIIPAQAPDSDLVKEVDITTPVVPRGKPLYIPQGSYTQFNKQIAELKKQQEEEAKKNAPAETEKKDDAVVQTEEEKAETEVVPIKRGVVHRHMR